MNVSREEGLAARKRDTLRSGGDMWDPGRAV